MSFTQKVKAELINLEIYNSENFYELSALFLLCCEFFKDGKKNILIFDLQSVDILRRFLKLIKFFYRLNVYSVKKENILNKKNVYIIEFKTDKKISEIFQQNNQLINKILNSKKQQNLKAKKIFLRGVFLAAGTLLTPQKPRNHLEIFYKSESKMILIHKIMNDLELNARILCRKKGFLVYLKTFQKIIDFLRYIGISESVFKYENIKINKDLSHLVKSSINLEIANENKIISAAQKQIEQIELIKQKQIIQKNDKLFYIMELRMKYPNSSLKELEKMFFLEYQKKITKSGLNYYFQKINRIYNKIKESKYAN